MEIKIKKKLIVLNVKYLWLYVALICILSIENYYNNSVSTSKLAIFVGFSTASNLQSFVGGGVPLSEIDFGGVELYLSELRADNQGRLLLNGRSQSSLSKALNQLLSKNRKVNWERLNHLIYKSFPGPLGVDIHDIFLKYYKYKQVESLEVFPFYDLEKARKWIDDRQNLQEEHFGVKVAGMMFSEENDLARNMIESQGL